MMIEGVIIRELQIYKDQRGWLTEVYRNDKTKYEPAMSYVSVTNPGETRGPHEHVYQSDFFVFAGPGSFEVYLWDRREKSKTNGEYMKIEAGEDNPSIVIVPPGVVHGYKCVSNKPAYIINFPNKLYKGKNKKDEVDEIRWEEKGDSPYVIK